jgi:hypothetical protein
LKIVETYKDFIASTNWTTLTFARSIINYCVPLVIRVVVALPPNFLLTSFPDCFRIPPICRADSKSGTGWLAWAASMS